jgi:hypothetical protein
MLLVTAHKVRSCVWWLRMWDNSSS